ncbi:unnamed protein product [Polarella glacialis]|uniref:Methyltransferase type 11 domain-containing protein n=1 Tax=Polarella glacialis TaxID=89957 RepID=A0A813L8V8_POLGL|nr:unnamed protein product [Polarella glacialis]
MAPAVMNLRAPRKSRRLVNTSHTLGQIIRRGRTGITWPCRRAVASAVSLAILMTAAVAIPPAARAAAMVESTVFLVSPLHHQGSLSYPMLGLGRRQAQTIRRALSETEAAKMDSTPDELFYLFPRIGLHHVDDGFRAQLTQLYRLLLPRGGDILDLCSQHDSHLPPEVDYNSLTVHGMNYLELLANQRATGRIVRNLNRDQAFPELEESSLDAALMALSIQYMQKPVEILRGISQRLRPGGVIVVSFSNRMFPTKAVAAWRDAGSMSGLANLVMGYMREAGFKDVRTANGVSLPGESRGRGDPFLAVLGFKDETEGETSAPGRQQADSLEGVSWLPETGSRSIW